MSLVSVKCQINKTNNNNGEIYFKYSYRVPLKPTLGSGLGKIKSEENFYDVIYKEIEREIGYLHHTISDFSCEIKTETINNS